MKRIVVSAAVIRDSQGRVFATQRGYGDWKGWWEFPGGKIEPGETPQQALQREILEELDVEIRVGEHLVTVEYDYPAFHLTMHCYLCTLESGAITLKEHASARWLAPSQLYSVQWLPADMELVCSLQRGVCS